MFCPDSGDMSPGEFLDTVRDQLGDEAARQIEKLLKQGLSMKVIITAPLRKKFSPLKSAKNSSKIRVKKIGLRSTGRIAADKSRSFLKWSGSFF